MQLPVLSVCKLSILQLLAFLDIQWTCSRELGRGIARLQWETAGNWIIIGYSKTKERNELIWRNFRFQSGSCDSKSSFLILTETGLMRLFTGYKQAGHVILVFMQELTQETGRQLRLWTWGFIYGVLPHDALICWWIWSEFSIPTEHRVSLLIGQLNEWVRWFLLSLAHRIRGTFRNNDNYNNFLRC